MRDFQRPAHDLVEVDRDERLVAAGAREFLQPADGLRPVEGRALDNLQPLAELRILQALQRELSAAQDRRQQIVEVVRHARGHLAERAELLRAHELVLRRGELTVRPGALLVEPRAAQRQGGEVADAGQEALVGLAEGSRRAAQGQHADHRVPGRHRNAEPVPRLGKRPDGRDAAPRALGYIVVRANRLARLENGGHEPDGAGRIA